MPLAPIKDLDYYTLYEEAYYIYGSFITTLRLCRYHGVDYVVSVGDSNNYFYLFELVNDEKLIAAIKDKFIKDDPVWLENELWREAYLSKAFYIIATRESVDQYIESVVK